MTYQHEWSSVLAKRYSRRRRRVRRLAGSRRLRRILRRRCLHCSGFQRCVRRHALGCPRQQAAAPPSACIVYIREHLKGASRRNSGNATTSAAHAAYPHKNRTHLGRPSSRLGCPVPGAVRPLRVAAALLAPLVQLRRSPSAASSFAPPLSVQHFGKEAGEKADEKLNSQRRNEDACTAFAGR